MNLTRQRLFLIFLAAVCALPLVLSYATYYWWKPERRMNYGELMDMRSVPPPVTWLNGTTAPHQGKWTLFLVGTGECAESCERYLYAMRQTRQSMGVKKEKLEVLWLVADPKEVRQDLLGRYPELKVAKTPDAYASILPQPAAGRIYLVDPDGRLVLRYPEQLEPARMIRDLARLLDVKRM
jgi:hypothetical protein